MKRPKSPVHGPPQCHRLCQSQHFCPNRNHSAQKRFLCIPDSWKTSCIYFVFLQERGTPPLRPPPRPQAKTCPPISRVFKRRQELFAAQAVSFRDPCEDESLTASPFPTSKHYEPTNKASYFEQVKNSLKRSRQTDDLVNFFISGIYN